MTQQAYWLVTWWSRTITDDVLRSQITFSYDAAERFIDVFDRKLNTDFEITGPFYKRMLQ